MDHFAGLDVSVKETSLCIVDDAGRIVREVKVASEPEALLAMLMNPACQLNVTPSNQPPWMPYPRRNFEYRGPERVLRKRMT